MGCSGGFLFLESFHTVYSVESFVFFCFFVLHQLTPQDVADESGHVNITKFLEEGESTESIAEYPRNINMMDVSVLLAVELVLPI